MKDSYLKMIFTSQFYCVGEFVSENMDVHILIKVKGSPKYFTVYLLPKNLLLFWKFNKWPK